jgi:hypothetical protein
MLVIEEEEQEAMKGEQLKDEKSSQTSSVGSKPSDGKRELSSSNSIKILI